MNSRLPHFSVPTLWRGNAAVDAPASRIATLERCLMNSQAERGNYAYCAGWINE